MILKEFIRATSDKQQQLQTAYQNGATNEFAHAWNTHVVPLQEENKMLNQDIASYRNGHEINAGRLNDLIVQRNDLASENKLLREQIEQMKLWI